MQNLNDVKPIRILIGKIWIGEQCVYHEKSTSQDTGFYMEGYKQL